MKCGSCSKCEYEALAHGAARQLPLVACRRAQPLLAQHRNPVACTLPVIARRDSFTNFTLLISFVFLISISCARYSSTFCGCSSANSAILTPAVLAVTLPGPRPPFCENGTIYPCYSFWMFSCGVLPRTKRVCAFATVE